MTRDAIVGLGWVVLFSGLAAFAFDLFLLGQAWISRKVALAEPASSPERIASDAEVLDGVGRVLMAGLIAALGLIWLLSVMSAPPAPPDQDVSIGPVALALVVVLVAMAVLSVLQSVRGLLYWQRLRDSLTSRREVCAATTFEGCPYISPERLLEVRAKALQIAEEIEPYTHEQH